MAFAVDTPSFTRLRAGLREVLERGLTRTLRSLWPDIVPAHDREWKRVRWRLPSDLLLRWCRAVGAAGGRETEEALAEVTAWLHQRPSAVMKPDLWLGLCHCSVEELRPRVEAGSLKNGDTLPDLLVQVAVSQLRELMDESPPEEDASSPECPIQDVAWVAGLRFKTGEAGRMRAHVEGPTTDAVVIPDGVSFDTVRPESPCDVLAAVRDRVHLWHLLMALVGPYIRSRGPGPFLAPEALGHPIEDPTWCVLPLFEVGRPGAAQHWRWPLLRAWYIPPGEADAVRRRVETARPSRAWHQRFNAAKVEPERWRTLVQTRWPHLRERFTDLLAEATHAGRTVVLVEAELGHATVVPVEASGERILV